MHMEFSDRPIGETPARGKPTAKRAWSSSLFFERHSKFWVRVRPSSTPNYVVETEHFDVEKHNLWYKIPAPEFVSLVLKLIELVVTELTKLSVEEELGFLVAPVDDSNAEIMQVFKVELLEFAGGLVKDDTWAYYDELVPGWCVKWEEEKAKREAREPSNKLRQ
ncbi:hypothetical protein DL95DRAFT_454838 [Leptodontidium sp. 2 PMI_412]|nr:hypothetical protein DL95DRAFT_454838 [Leptodontidium sp. 2 PMI_412]